MLGPRGRRQGLTKLALINLLVFVESCLYMIFAVWLKTGSLIQWILIGLEAVLETLLRMQLNKKWPDTKKCVISANQSNLL